MPIDNYDWAKEELDELRERPKKSNTSDLPDSDEVYESQQLEALTR